MIAATEEEVILGRFREKNSGLFKKNEALLIAHLATVFSLLILFSASAIFSPLISLKILAGFAAAFLWFCLINVTIHHHHTHKNAASKQWAKNILNGIYMIAMPNAPKRLNRYTRAHLNHHARPFHESDVDHHYGTERFLRMMKNPVSAALYFLELTFVGGHMPGWQDDKYMNQVPLEKWNGADYEKIKQTEQREAVKIALLQWGGFLAVVCAPVFLPGLNSAILYKLVSAFVWGWAFPMLMVKNWAHFLGQFQHYDPRFLQDDSTVWTCTKTYHVSSFLNYLCGGEISGHFLHHLFPELPYYRVEDARKLFVADPELSSKFAIY